MVNVEPIPEPPRPSTLDTVAEIAGIERQITELQARLSAALGYRKQLYGNLGLDAATEQLDVAVSAKPIGVVKA